MESLKTTQAPEIQRFGKIDNKEIIEINAKLDILKLIGGIVDSLREGLTRQLVVNGIEDDELLSKKLDKMEVIEEMDEVKGDAYTHYTEDVGMIEP